MLATDRQVSWHSTMFSSQPKSTVISALILQMLLQPSLLLASDSTSMFSFNVGAQFLENDIEIARTKAEQKKQVSTFGLRYEARLAALTWGIAFDTFKNKWVTGVPSTRTDGDYTITSLFLELKKSQRIYRDLFIFGGGGAGIVNIDSRYADSVGRSNRSFRVAAIKGIIGVEWRFDVSAIYLDTQWSVSEAAQSSSRYDHYSGLFGPRIGIGVGFFF